MWRLHFLQLLRDNPKAPASCRYYKTWSSHTTIFISYHVLTISHHNMPCKNKLDVLYFVVASFTWLLRASSKNRSYLRHKTTTMVYQVCCFNLQQGLAVVKFESTKVGETDTRQPPLCKKLVACLPVEAVSWMRSCKVGPGCFIQQYRRLKIRHWW